VSKKIVKKMEKIKIRKQEATHILSKRQILPPKHLKNDHKISMYFSVRDECIINDCNQEDLFKQNYFYSETSWFSKNRAELASRNLLELTHWQSRTNEDFNNCFLGYNGGYFEMIDSGSIDVERCPACRHKSDFCNFPKRKASENFKNEIFEEFDTFKDYYWPQLKSRSEQIRLAAVRKLRKHLNQDICSIKKFGPMGKENKRGRSRYDKIFEKTFPLVKNLPNKRVGSNCSIDVPTNLQVANYDSSMNYGLSFVGCFVIIGFFVRTS